MMIDTDVVLVLGAGASKGYPLGRGLVDLALKEKRDSVVRRVMDAGIADHKVAQFLIALEECGYDSVDALLEARGGHDEEFERIGRLVIASVLMDFETKAIFEGSTQENWYRWLYREMTTHGIDRFNENRIRIITFNYDRSLEHFLMHALQRSNGQHMGHQSRRIRELDIIHLHGNLSPLTGLGDNARAYGPPNSIDEIVAAANSIKIIHQAKGDSPEFKRATTYLQNARYILFLGFGYNPTNVKRLQLVSLVGKREEGTIIHGTTQGFLRSELELNLYPLFEDAPGGFYRSGQLRHAATQISDTDMPIELYVRRYLEWFTYARGYARAAPPVRPGFGLEPLPPDKQASGQV